MQKCHLRSFGLTNIFLYVYSSVEREIPVMFIILESISDIIVLSSQGCYFSVSKYMQSPACTQKKIKQLCCGSSMKKPVNN